MTTRRAVIAPEPRGPAPPAGGYLERLAARSAVTGSLLSLGIDPDPDALPPGFGRNLAGVERFARLILDACLPVWVREGGTAPMLERLKDPAIRARVKREMDDPNAPFENQWYGSGGPAGVMLSSVLDPSLRKYEGLNFAEIGTAMGKDPRDAAIDLVIADKAESSVIISIMREEDVVTAMRTPWVSFDTDSGARAEDGPLSESKSHPRAWGTFTRVLAKYVRDDKVLTLEEAVRLRASDPPRMSRQTVHRYVRWTGRVGASPSLDQVNSSATSIRPHVAHRVAKRSPIETLRLDSPRGDADMPWNAASRWRTSGGRSTTSASIRVSGLDSIEMARRCRSTAARATQPPRPARSATTSPGPVWASIRAASRSAGGAGANRSKTGRLPPTSAREAW